MLNQVFGHHATEISLDERFTMLASLPHPKPARQRRRSIGSLLDPIMNNRNRKLIEQIARRLNLQAKRRTLHQRLGVPRGALRRYGSESHLLSLRSFGGFGNLSQRRDNWGGSNNNMSRTSSFSNLSQAGLGRGRGRGRGQGQGQGRGVARLTRGAGRNMRGNMRGVSQGRVTRSQTLQQPRGQARGRGAARGRGRGRGGGRPANTPVPSAEELDLQLDQYMAGSKSALDSELEAYMSAAADADSL